MNSSSNTSKQGTYSPAQKIVITGNTSGIGKQIQYRLKTAGYEVLGLSKSNGFDLADTSKVVQAILDFDPDVVFNNAYHPEGQLKLLTHLHALWTGRQKVIINTGAFRNIDLIYEIANKYGSQCLVGSIEAKKNGSEWYCYTDNGREPTDFELKANITRTADIGLIPMYSTLNHHNGQVNTRLERDEDGELSVYALHDIPPNTPLYLTYGRSGLQSSVDVFNTYGFVEEYPQLWR